MPVELNWRGDAVLASIEANCVRRVTAATEVLSDAIRAEAPSRTGRLRESIVPEVDPTPPIISGGVRIAARYASFVDRDNPFVERGIARARPAVQDILTSGGQFR
jgi:hypothetical protein